MAAIECRHLIEETEMCVKDRLCGLAALVASAFMACTSASATTPADTTSSTQAAVWVPKEFNFVYLEFTTRYSCDGLQERMRTLLLALGARDDLHVLGYGCTRLAGPDPLASVRIKINVLQPANDQAEHTVP